MLKLELIDWIYLPPDPGTDCEEVRRIPPMQRRRLGQAGKLAVGAFLELLTRNSCQPSRLIFASHSGEVLRCLKLMRSLFAGEELSPAEFSASVQNSSAGIASITAGFRGEVTALNGGQETVRAAMLESFLPAGDGGDGTVLTVLGEEDICRQSMMDFPVEMDLHGPGALGLLLAPDGRGLGRLLTLGDHFLRGATMPVLAARLGAGELILD